MLALFDKLKIKDADMAQWFATLLRARNLDTQHENKHRRESLQRQISTLVSQQERLLNLRLHEEIDASTFTPKNNELKDRISRLKLKLDGCHRS